MMEHRISMLIDMHAQVFWEKTDMGCGFELNFSQDLNAY
jgi:hypothetical protein